MGMDSGIGHWRLLVAHAQIPAEQKGIEVRNKEKQKANVAMSIAATNKPYRSELQLQLQLQLFSFP